MTLMEALKTELRNELGPKAVSKLFQWALVGAGLLIVIAIGQAALHYSSDAVALELVKAAAQ